MYNLTLESKEGYKIEFNQIGGAFSVVAITGLSPAEATINTNENALIDGSTFNSSKVNMRTFNIGFSIDRDPEQNRAKVYKVLRPKELVKIYYKSDLYDVYCEGYVQAVTVSHFEMKQTVTAIILCPFPYWKKAQQIIDSVTVVRPLFHFPFASTEEPEIVFGVPMDTPTVTVYNGGAVETGLVFEIVAYDTVSGPKIYNYSSQEFFGLDVEMVAGDQITVKTGQGEKTAVLLRNGIETNIFNLILEGSTWLQLPVDGAVFTFTVESGSAGKVEIAVKHYDLYEGV